MKYPKAEIYEKLYQKYIDHRPPTELVDLVGDVSGKIVWDLCCGSGRMSVVCAERGAKSITCVDSEFFMTTPVFWGLEEFRKKKGLDYRILTSPVSDFLKKESENPDVVLCRQGVNYWMNEGTVHDLAKRMGKGSVFVFNTFNTLPGLKPDVKEYELKIGDNGDSYRVAFFVEVSWYIPETNKVSHVQIRNGMEPHFTSFDWITRKQFQDWLSPHFLIDCRDEGKTALYRCERK